MNVIAQCASLAEVRHPIDRVDRQLVARIAERGADPVVVEATWRAMIGAFIDSERQLQAALHPPSPQPN